MQVSPLHIYRIKDRCLVLGPGVRAVIWFQGCSFACKGCIAHTAHPDSYSILIVNSSQLAGFKYTASCTRQGGFDIDCSPMGSSIAPRERLP